MLDLVKFVTNLISFSVFLSISTMGNVPQGRSWHSLSPVSDKHLFLYGGYNNDQDVLGM